MGSLLGVMKVAATRAGITLDEYRSRVAAGEKWCTACKTWHPRAEFGRDTTRRDGLTATCTAARKARYHDSYVPRPRPRGRFFVPARDGDRLQARARVNHRIRVGLIPSPNTLPCKDCGHLRTPEDRRRHEYDHHLGYDAAHHLDVEAVCTACHRQRELSRGVYPRRNEAA